MAKFLLSLHVLVSVLFIGPVAVAVSMFPARARAALAGGPDRAPETGSVRLLHRITQVYAGLGLAVPVLGIGTAQVMDVLGQSWLIVSMVLTALAALSLLLFVLPAQQAAVDALELADPQAPEHAKAVQGLRLLPMTAGVFNLLWAVVVVLMVIRPGSTTGA
ncbi:membrane protein [Kitasatospora herbaricolor]|uniref:DUF2269 family protein n=1 Tax=Kitasatospora herbaricolor TaxID=68217 RepID=UPI00174D02A9|nr:DUF2269 family protein [Kitasatospora herbaricolor]MDQ0308074.1 heme/copper-type cytochrome/quinol oxidase subunit 2 [Kitasatospora herbaricolor]GGV05220.1 membrane protein [Kitasatospora herbaricolor]